jgi:hypothetical protein
VACELLNEFLVKWESRQGDLPLAERLSMQPVVTYLGAMYAKRFNLMVTFPQAWETFNRTEFRQALALAVAVL